MDHAPAPARPSAGRRPHVVVLGGGFAGVECAKALRRAPVRVTLVDRTNHHLFQPLLYQVATAALSPANIAAPLREIFAEDEHVEVVLDEVTGLDVGTRTVRLASGSTLRGDVLVVATGLVPHYFGNDQWRPIAPPLKTIGDALTIRERFLLSFEAAERETDPAARRRDLTFVVVGAGPTGVEMAGAMAELGRKTLRSEFRSIDPRTTRVVLIEGLDRVLPAMHRASSARALEDLRSLGVEVRLGRMAETIDDRGVTLDDGDRIEAGTVVWAAGVGGSSVVRAAGLPLTNDERVEVEPDCSVPGHRNVFVAGDLARLVDRVDDSSGEEIEVPGLAPAAIQMGRYVGRLIDVEARARAEGREPPSRRPFRYVDKGALATIGRHKAVADVFGRHFGGWIAFLLWAGVHIWFLVGYRNRILTMMQWVWHYVRYDRAARIITGGVRPRWTSVRGADEAEHSEPAEA